MKKIKINSDKIFNKSFLIVFLSASLFLIVIVYVYYEFINPIYFLRTEKKALKWSLDIPNISITPTILVKNQEIISNLNKTDNTDPWGVARQIDEHTWTIKIGEDPIMANSQEILQAINEYRKNHGSQPLVIDQKLADYAKSRADYFTSIKNLDGHKGFNNFLESEDGYKKLGYNWVGENASIGYRLNGTHLIEWVFAGDKPHNNNQLDGKWDHVGIGVNGTAVCFIFATAKM